MQSVRLLVVAAWVLVALPLHAQSPRYTPPAGDPLPNALNYFRRDVGVLDPYNAFVEPRRQLDRRIQRMEFEQEASDRRQQSAINQVRRPAAAPTGSGATFMNYSHYYRMPAAVRARSR
jgi:hypothetical protein